MQSLAESVADQEPSRRFQRRLRQQSAQLQSEVCLDFRRQVVKVPGRTGGRCQVGGIQLASQRGEQLADLVDAGLGLICRIAIYGKRGVFGFLLSEPGGFFVLHWDIRRDQNIGRSNVSRPILGEGEDSVLGAEEGEHACKDHQQQDQSRDPSGAHLV